MEIEYAYLSKSRPNFNRTPSKIDILQYEQILIDGYDKFENDIKVQAKKEFEIHSKKLEAFNKKKCLICGASLKLIEYYDPFWGCPNYRDGRKHTTFSKNPYFNYAGERVGKDWVTDIIKECGLKGKVKAKQAFELFQSLGFEDLRAKYYEGADTNATINSLVATNKNSKEQEWYCNLFLKTIYPTVIEQQLIIYKIKGDKQRMCIPDFICGSEFEVLIADAKLDHIKEEQMDLYTSLISFIMKQKKDDRPVNGMFILYDGNINHFKTKYQIHHLKPWELDGWDKNPYR